MATKKQIELERRLASLDAAARDAFYAAISAIKSGASEKFLIEALKNKQIDNFMKELNITISDFYDFDETVKAAAIAEGQLLTEGVRNLARAQGHRMIVKFNARNPELEQELLHRSATRVSAISEDARKEVRKILQEVTSQGRNPRSAILDLIGEQRPDGIRRGGVIGLAENQKEWIENAREELSNQKTMTKFLARSRRDPRLDSLVHRAIKEKRSLTSGERRRLLNAYEDGVLSYRAETVARTEVLRSANLGRFKSASQIQDEEQVEMEKSWSDSGDSRVRDSHSAMNRQRKKMKEPFVSPRGGRMMYPGDTSLGASGADTIQCRCFVNYHPDFLAGAK